ncbi:hypothetical protein Tco_1441214 [Tanacetum coccineum]
MSSRVGSITESDHNKKRGMVLPFVPLSIVFDNIIYVVDMPPEMQAQGQAQDRLELLKGVSGASRPGILTALMGYRLDCGGDIDVYNIYALISLTDFSNASAATRPRLPPDFVGLARINTKENIIVKSLDGNETQMALRSPAATIVTTHARFYFHQRSSIFVVTCFSWLVQLASGVDY